MVVLSGIILEVTEVIDACATNFGSCVPVQEREFYGIIKCLNFKVKMSDLLIEER